MSGSRDKTLRVWNLNASKCETVLRTPSSVRAVALSATINRVVLGTSSGEIRIYEIRGIDSDNKTGRAGR
jgi:WD40 repeat protein